MAQYKLAIPYAKKDEGGWCNTPGDRGGETYEAIARADHPDCGIWPLIDAWKVKYGTPPWNQIFDIPGLQEIVDQFFEVNYWEKMQGNGILMQPVATYFYDWFINSQGKAVMRLQEILNVPQTGHFGSITLAKVNTAGAGLLLPLHERRMKFYYDHVALAPEDKKFLKGWIDRCEWLYASLTPALSNRVPPLALAVAQGEGGVA